ncbi:protein of unknown function (plasmid) [Magnetospirillum sp. XM-1]|uniref:hypothetical protein n=1 Tax=unclassified Magnetospirillum TaxID=2617991 RepID=UPI00073DDF43|nr:MULTISPECIES: hypothetical protein [unclassified Magnetospirillum]ARJ66111.1 hypothetical protein WV31_10775 [Magnetospirillum sp. ME-1]CUW41902.1 protein of unknown function [Magnetospirillum sp. XM-1]
MEHDEFNTAARILYPGAATARGQEMTTASLADGLGVEGRKMRKWKGGQNSAPAIVSDVILAAATVADDLALADQPRGTRIVWRMADVIRDKGARIRDLEARIAELEARSPG